MPNQPRTTPVKPPPTAPRINSSLRGAASARPGGGARAGGRTLCAGFGDDGLCVLVTEFAGGVLGNALGGTEGEPELRPEPPGAAR